VAKNSMGNGLMAGGTPAGELAVFRPPERRVLQKTPSATFQLVAIVN